MLDRVLIRGQGWGPADTEKGAREDADIRTRLLERKTKARTGSRPISHRSFRQAVRDLEGLGLICVFRRRGRPSRVRPVWWSLTKGFNLEAADAAWGKLATLAAALSLPRPCPLLAPLLPPHFPLTSPSPVRQRSPSIPGSDADLNEIAGGNSGGTLRRITDDVERITRGRRDRDDRPPRLDGLSPCPFDLFQRAKTRRENRAPMETVQSPGPSKEELAKIREGLDRIWGANWRKTVAVHGPEGSEHEDLEPAGPF